PPPRPKPAQQNNNEKETPPPSHKTGKRTNLRPRHLSKRFSFATHAAGEDHEVVNSATDTHPDHQPQQSRQKTKLRRQHWTNQWSSTGDGSKVMPEQHPL